MKLKIYLLLPTVLLLSSYSFSQTVVEKNGIKKKLSELLTAKPVTGKPVDEIVMKRLKLRSQTLPNFIEREKKSLPTEGSARVQNDDETEMLNESGTSILAGAGTTQQPWSNFLDTYNSTPIFFSEDAAGLIPDPSGSVGPNQVIVVTNIDMNVFDKPSLKDPPLLTPTGYSNETATAAFSISLSQFFSPVLVNGYPAHPNIRYDRLSKRWFVAAIEIDDSHQNNLVLLAVSDGDKITSESSFTFYSFNSSLFPYDHNAPYAPFLDIPSLGVDRNSVLIAGSQYGYDSITFAGYVINKQKLLGGKLSVQAVELGSFIYETGTAQGLYLPTAVYNDDPDARKSFFIGLDYNEFTLDIAAINYDKNKKPRLAYQEVLAIPNYNFTRDMSSPGGMAPVYNLPINERRIRFLQAAIHKNKLTGKSSLWTAHAIGVDQSGEFIPPGPAFLTVARNATRWYKINRIYSPNPVLAQTGTIYDTDPSGRRATQYFNPSIAASGQGHAIIGGTTTAFDEYLNVFAAGRYLGDGSGKTKAPVKVTNTNAIFDPFYIDRLVPERDYDASGWGGYSQTVVDPIDDQTMWTFQEYAAIDDSWGIRVVQFKAPPPAIPKTIGTLSNEKDATIILEGKSINNSGFFDPGTDEGGPGYNHLSVKSGGDISVKEITFISPTKISFTLNTKGKPSGNYHLTITNPDGQSVETEYTIAEQTITVPEYATSSSIPEPLSVAKKLSNDVYPNPAKDVLNVKIVSSKNGHINLVVTNVSGETVINKGISSGTNESIVHLRISHIPAGTYFLKIVSDDGKESDVKKFIKQ